MTSSVARAVDEGWSPDELFRLCIVEFARRFHTRSEPERRGLVEERPALTNTVWDAVSGASIEHICLNHGCRPPGWTEEPERFRNGPETLLFEWTENVLCHLPAPFTRRGISLVVPTPACSQTGRLARTGRRRSGRRVLHTDMAVRRGPLR